MSNKRILSTILTGVALAWLIWLFRSHAPAPSLDAHVCANWQSGCAFLWQGGSARLSFLDRPSPLKPFRIQIAGVPAGELSIRFAMRDMEMPAPAFTLRRTGAATWTGRAILPVCTQKRGDWIVTLKDARSSASLAINLPSGAT